jgi:hypothetical protein
VTRSDAELLAAPESLVRPAPPRPRLTSDRHCRVAGRGTVADRVVASFAPA